MIGKNDENLRELLTGFFNAREASKVAEDIVSGENILDSNPAPLPSPDLLADIKQNMLAAVQKNRQHSYKLIWQYAAAAAVIIIVFGAGIILLHKPAQQLPTYASVAFWHDAFTSIENTIDAQLADIEFSEPDSPLLPLEARVSPENNAINDLAIELDDIDATFWEG